MARVTIEDCLLYIPNRFKIVELAAKRARELANGGRTTVGGDSAADHKVTVLALREIATGEYNENTQAEKFEEFSIFEDDDETTEATAESSEVAAESSEAVAESSDAFDSADTQSEETIDGGEESAQTDKDSSE